MVFKPFRTWSKINKFKESFYRCKIQVSLHMSLNFPGQHIYQIGDITPSTALVFGLGHNMGRFTYFVLGSTLLLHHFLGSKKVAKNRNYDAMY